MQEPVFWSMGTWRLDRRVAVIAAPSQAAAMLALGIRETWAVKACWAAELRAPALAEPGKVHMLEVDQLPSAYDKFVRPGMPGWDYQAMEDEGFDVS